MLIAQDHIVKGSPESHSKPGWAVWIQVLGRLGWVRELEASTEAVRDSFLITSAWEFVILPLHWGFLISFLVSGYTIPISSNPRLHPLLCICFILWFHLVWSVLSYDLFSGNVLVSVLPNCRSLSYHFAFSWERVRVCICTSKRESDICVGLSSLANSFLTGWWPDCRTGDLWVSCIPLAN